MRSDPCFILLVYDIIGILIDMVTDINNTNWTIYLHRNII